VAGIDQLLGPPRAHRARQVLRAACAGHDAERYLGQGKARAPRCIDEVAAERELAPAAEGRPVHSSDHRHRTVDDCPDHALEHVVLGIPLLVAHALALLEIGTGAKGTVAAAGEHHDPGRRRIGDDAREQLQQFAADRRIHGVCGIGAIDRDHQDMVRALDQQRLELGSLAHPGIHEFPCSTSGPIPEP
jgi:hypothetical protein